MTILEQITEMLAEEFVYNIEKAVLKVEKKDTHIQLDADRIVAIALTPQQAAKLNDAKWFEMNQKAHQNGKEESK